MGDERNDTNGDYGTGGVKASETTSINLTPIRDEPTIEPKLSPEERAAVEALPSGSALLVAHSGPNAGARFLLDSDVTTAGPAPGCGHLPRRRDGVPPARRIPPHRASFEVVDTGSLNGTYVNHDRVDSLELRSGNEVQIGKFRLTFYLSPARAAGQV